MKKLTERQLQILNFVSDFTEKNSCPPTIRETANNFGVSVRAIQDHFNALEKKGYLTRTENQSRSIRLVKGNNSSSAQKIPLLKEINAEKLFLESNVEKQILFCTLAQTEGEYFAFRVPNSSMEARGIFEGDIAVIRRQESVKENDIVVALSSDELFFSDVNSVLPKNAQILGKLVQLIREFE